MESNYQPAGCEHKLPSGLSAWVFQSEESGSGPDMYFDVHVCVCRLCGSVRVGGFRQDKEGKLNRFSEEIDLHAAEAIDAIVKYANYIHGEKVWGRLNAQAGAKWVKASERLPEKGGKENSVVVRGVFKEPGYNEWPFVAYGYRNFNPEKQQMYFELGSKSYLTNDVEWMDESPSRESDAVGFAEWLNDYAFKSAKGDAWVIRGSAHLGLYSCDQLYAIFKQQNEK